MDHAIEELIEIGGLHYDTSLTTLGSYLAPLPLEPRKSKLLLYAQLFGCKEAALSMLAAADAKDPFMQFGSSRQAMNDTKLHWAGPWCCDAAPTIHALNEFLKESSFDRKRFCDSNQLSYQGLDHMARVRKELAHYMETSDLVPFQTSLEHNEEMALLMATIVAAYFPQVARLPFSARRPRSSSKYQGPLKVLTQNHGSVMVSMTATNGARDTLNGDYLAFGKALDTGSVQLMDTTVVPTLAVASLAGTRLEVDAGSLGDDRIVIDRSSFYTMWTARGMGPILSKVRRLLGDELRMSFEAKKNHVNPHFRDGEHAAALADFMRELTRAFLEEYRIAAGELDSQGQPHGTYPSQKRPHMSHW